MTDPAPGTDRSEAPPDRFEALVITVVYVVPLTAAVVFLAVVGLAGLALALLAVEGAVSTAVLLAKRPEGAPPGRLALAAGLLTVLAGCGAAAVLSGAV